MTKSKSFSISAFDFNSKRKKRRAKQNSSQLQFEKLEPRQMLANVVVFQANFEDVTVPEGEYRFFSSVSGFTATGFPVEVQHNDPTVGPASQGSNLLELDGTNGVFVQIDNVPNEGLVLRGDYSPRPGFNATRNAIDVLWNGAVIATLAENGRENSSTVFNEFEFNLPSKAGQTSGRLEFRSTFENDFLGVGGLLDDIKVFDTTKQPPNLNPISDQTVDENKKLSVQFSAADSDSQKLRFSTPRAPLGSTIDPITGVFEWTPNAYAGGLRFGVDVLVTDETGLTDNQTFRINVIDAAPQLQQPSDTTIDEGETLSIQLIATDPNSTQSQLRFSTSRSPVGSTLDPVTGVFTWIPNQFAGGLRFGIDVSVADETGQTDTKTFRVSVNELDSAPRLEFIDDQTTTERDTLSFQLVATDADSPQSQLRYSLQRAPMGATLDPVTGLFEWTPNQFAGGLRFGVDVEVTDETGLKDSQTFWIDVEDITGSPVLDSVSDRTITELEPISIQLFATDSNSNQSDLRYAAPRAPFGSTLDPITGMFNWVPNRYAGGLQFGIDVRVTDETGLSNQKTFRIQVENLNVAPVLNPIGDQTVERHSELTFTATASDDDRPVEQLTFSLSGDVPGGAKIDPVTGQFTWIPMSSTPAGTYAFEVVVEDGSGNQDSQKINVVVTSIDDDVFLIEESRFETEEARLFPISGETKQLSFEYETLFDFTETDSINDAFEVALLDEVGNSLVHTVGKDRDAFFNVTEGEAVLNGANTIVDGSTVKLDLSHIALGATANLVFRLVNNDSDDNTEIRVTSIATSDEALLTPSGDSAGESSSRPNEPIDFASLRDVTGSMLIDYGHTSLNPATDSLYSQVKLTNVGQLPVSGRILAVFEKPSNESVRMLRPDGRLPDGRFFIELTSESGTLRPGDMTFSRDLAISNPINDRFDFDLKILAGVNSAPIRFDSIPPTDIEAGRTVKYTAIAVDPEGQTLTYSVITGTKHIEINSETGELTWNTTADDIGSHVVTIRATDPFGLFIEQTFSVEVHETLQNRPPTFVTNPVTDAIASSGFEITTVGVGGNPVGIGVASGFRGPRLVTANSGDQTIGVYAGENNDRFDDSTSYPAGFPVADGQLFDVGYAIDVGLPEFTNTSNSNAVEGMDQGDLNGDGILDLVVMTTYDVPSTGARYQLVISTLLGDGNGRFGDPHEIYRHTYSTYTFDARNLVLRDVNNDGALDVLAIERQRDPRLISILGNGDGTFATAAEQTFDGKPLSEFHVADIDEDGILDLIGRNVTGGYTFEAVWSKGAGDGSFGEPIVIGPAGFTFSNTHVRAHDVLDLNGDDNLDFVFMANNNVTIYHSDGLGNFTLASEFQPSSTGADRWIRGGDFNGDGFADLVYHSSFNSNFNLLFGDGSGIDFTLQLGPNLAGGIIANYAGSDSPADIDGDGDLDLIFGHSGGDFISTKVALNDGSGNFSITEYAMVDFSSTDVERYAPDDVARGGMYGDYNQDGVIDFSYFTSGGDFNGVGIRLGTRPGEFGQTRTIPWLLGTRGDDATPGDFNGDGVVDLIDTVNDRIFLGVGDGAFAEPFPAFGVLGLGYASVADFNLDGIDDIVAARSNRYFVALANGDGTFTISDDQLAEGSFYGYSSTLAADFNADGYPDFVAKTGVERQIDVHLNDPENPGVFSRSFRLTLPSGSQGINVSNWQESYAVADFTGDGIVDLAFAEREEYTSESPMLVVIMAGDGKGDFARHSELAGYDEAGFVGLNGASFYAPGDYSAGDIDSDGDVDLVSVTNYGARLFLNDGTGNFEFFTHLESPGVEQRGRDSWLIDFNEDGKLDLIQLGSGGFGPLSVRLGNGDATFQTSQTVGTIGGDPGNLSRQPFADLDGDGHLDFVYTDGGAGNYNSNSTAIFAGRRDDLVDLLSVDLNGDGNEEVLAVQEQMDRLQIFVGDNLGGFTRQPDLQTGRAPQAIAVGDLNSDGNLELFTVNRASRDISVFTGNLEDGYSQLEISVGSRLVDIASADIDGDGNIDVVVLDDDTNALWVLAGDGTTLTAPTAIPLGDRPSRFVLGDADGDGTLDAIVTLPDSNRTMIVPDIGAGLPNTPIYVSTGSTPSDVAVLDLNADGNPDLVTTQIAEDHVGIQYGLGGGQFSRVQTVAVGDQPNRISTADADEDGRMDLIVSNAGDNTVSVIYNRFDPNEVYRYDADAIDPDDDALSYSIVDGPGGLIINSDTGALLWAASPDQVGTHEVTIAADDGRGGVATQSFQIEVEPARENSSPLIATTPATQIGAGELFEYQASAIDTDNHTVRYRLLEAPAGATIDPITGLVQWEGQDDGAISINRFASTHGDIRVPIGESSSLSLNSLTIEGWFNTQNLTSSNRDSLFRVGSSYNLLELRYFGDDELQLDLFDGNLSVDRFIVPIEVKVDQWRHFALSIDDVASTFDLLVDGQSVLSGELPSSFVYDDATRLDIGGGFASYSGLVDNFRVWNRARSVDEIREGFSRQYDGDPDLVLDFRFEDDDSRMVRDRTGNGNSGYYVTNQTSPITVTGGLAAVGSHDFVVGVEDGRGGYDQQSFTVNVVPELRGSIVGQVFNDLDDDGVRDDGSENPAEPALEGWRLYIDANRNHFLDPTEMQTTTDVDGNFRFDQLLPGDYPLRVEPVAGFNTPTIAPVQVDANSATSVNVNAIQQALSQIQGQLKTEDGQTIGYWEVFADLDQDGTLGAGEPSTLTDRDGVFALFGLEAGTYNVRTKLPAGWQETSDPLVVNLAEDEISDGNEILLKPTNTSVTGGVRFVTTAPTMVTARDVFRYSSLATSIVSQAITYEVSLAPEGLAIDPSTGLVAWRPTISQVGDHQVILRATAADGSISLQDFSVAVTAPNTSPVIGSLAPVDGFVGLGFAYDLSAQDAEGEAITFTLLNGPATASLQADSGQLRWIPQAGDIGSVSFEVEARDASGASSTQQFVVVVNDDQPSATPFIITSPRMSVGLGQGYVSQVIGVDQLERPLTWSKTSGPASLTIAENGEIRWDPRATELGQNTILLSATNVDGESEDYTLIIEVVGQPVIQTPAITSQPILSAVIGQQYRYDVLVDESIDNLFSFSLLDGPVGMSLHPTNGTLLWLPAADQLRESNVIIEVTNSVGVSTTQSFELRVSRAGGPPLITSTPSTEVNVGGAYLYSVIAEDTEGDPVSYRLLSAPAGLTIVESTGEISWTPTGDQLGSQEVVIEVVDGVGGAATQAFSILVGNGIVNLPPVITSTGPRFSAVGSNYDYQIEATDPESTNLTYSVGRGPAGLSVDENGFVSWIPAVGQTGKFVVTLIVTDEGGASAIESFELDVLAENRDPVINSTAPTESVLGIVFAYDLLVTDADLDRLHFELVQGPVGAEINSFGQIRWVNDNASLGAYDFEIKVGDPRGGEAVQSFTIDLVADTEAPRVSLIENLNDDSRNVLPWQGPFKVFVRAIDNVEVASLTLTANGQEILLDANGTATFTFEDWTFQSINATATAVDTSGNVTTKSITFDYDIPEGWTGLGGDEIPTALITSPGDADSVTGMVSIVGTADHEDFDIYRLSYRRVDQTTFTEILESRTAVANGELGVWDTSLLINDEYVLRLEVATSAGVANVVERQIGLAGQLKLGNFQLSFTDLVIPVAGIPIEITRVYDSLQADREGDFGYGWRLEFRDTDLRVGLPESGLEDIGIYSAYRSGVKVYLNVPGEGRQGFTFTPDVRILPGFGGENLVLGQPRFTADPGVTATLATGTSGYLQVNEQGEFYAPGGIPYNPASPDFGGAYVLTTREGITYRIDGASGKLVSATDRNGQSISYSDFGITSSQSDATIKITRGSHGRIESITDALDHSLVYSYSATGDLIRVVDRSGNTTRFNYHPERPHYLESVVDPLGRTPVRTEYSEDGRIEELVALNGSSILVDYDPTNSLEVVEDANGNQTFVEYNSFGKVVSQTNALGDRQSFEYDSNGQLISSTNALGQRTTQVNDQNGWLISTTDPLGLTTRYTRSDNGDLLATVSPLGHRSTYEYDANGNILAVSDPNGSEVRYEYNAAGHLTGLIDPAGVRTTIVTNGSGLPTQTRYANGVVETRQYDANGSVTSVLIESAGGVISATTFEYDEEGRVVKTVFPDGETITSTYDALGEISSQTDRLGRSSEREESDDGSTVTTVFAGESLYETVTSDTQVTTQVYGGVTQTVDLDALGRPSSVVQASSDSDSSDDAISVQYDAAGRVVGITGEGKRESVYNANGSEIRTTVGGIVIEREFDGDGQLTSETVDGRTTRYQYDAAGNVVEIRYPTGALEGFEYDERNNLSVYSQNGVTIRQFQYDPIGQLQFVVDKNQTKTEYSYDDLDRLVRVEQGGRTLRSYSYDLAGNQTRIEREDGSVVERVYDEANRIVQETNPDGTILVYAYDEFDRVVSRTTELGVAEFSYDESGYLAAHSNSNSSTTITRDEQGRETRIAQDEGFIDYEYDQNNRLETIETPAGTRIYEYDTEGLMVSVTDPFGNRTSYRYDGEQRVTEVTRPDGTIEKVSYTADSDVESVELLSSDSSLLYRWEYSFDSFGRLSGISTSDGADRSFEYSQDGFLIADYSIDSGGQVRQIRYEYDSFGNRIRMVDSIKGQTVYEYNDAGQLVIESSDSGDIRYSYDINGNLIQKEGPNETTIYDWDASGRLTRMEKTVGGETDVTQYIYDAFGKRTAVIRDGVTTYTIYETIDGVSRLLEELDTDGNVIRSFTYGNELTSVAEGTAARFPVFGGLGDAVAYSGENQFRLAANLDAFGHVLTSSDSIENPVIYRGQLLDEDLQMYSMGARNYDGSTGRFVSRDPLEGVPGEPVSYASYVYALNDPLNNTDPTGLTSLAEQLVTNVLKNRLFQAGIAQFLVGAVLRNKFGSTTWSGPTLNVETQYTGDFSIGYSQFTSETRLTAEGYQTADVGVITLSKEIFGKDVSTTKSKNNAKAERLRKRAKDVNARKGSKSQRRNARSEKQGLLAQADALQGQGLFASKISFSFGDAEVYSPGLFGLSFGSFVGTFTSAAAGFDASAGGGSASASASLGGSVVNYGFSAGYSIPDSSGGLSAASKKGQGYADAGFSFGISVGVSMPFEIGRNPAPKPNP
ncbi:MAG: putative Ig domain-containing protein [Planctomycetota bacterium]